MKKTLVISFLLILICGCTSGNESNSGEPLPDSITLSVSLPEDITVGPAERFSIEAIGEFSPYHPDIQLTYTWSKIIFPKAFNEILNDFGGDAFEAIGSLDAENDFAHGKVLSDISPTLYEGGFVQYEVEIGARGYAIDYLNLPQRNSLLPTSALFKAYINVYVVE